MSTTIIKEKTKKLKIIALDEINRRIESDPVGLIAESEDMYNLHITTAAKKIAEDFEKKPIVLLSGPSGSGKTTSAYRISYDLKSRGINSVVISMDDYFLPNHLIPLEPDGSIDYEKPERVDIALLQQHLAALARGDEIEKPSFDFATGTRQKGSIIRRDNNTAIIIEGIHALNPAVTGSAHEFATFIYVSVRTRIADKNGELLHPSKIRLLRRMSRDRLFRGRDIKSTIEKYGSVQKGENLYIMPYKPLADFDIDTFLAYELCVYRSVMPELTTYHGNAKQDSMYSVLPRFMKLAAPLDTKLVPDNSIIKEFIGK